MPRIPVGARYPREPWHDVLELPTSPYVGLTEAEAEARAAAEGRHIVVMEDIGRGRPMLVPLRLRVELDGTGRVARAGAG